MSPRELIIFLLGLAIVAVILRGLYVALQARRGQIKLAIDKNIPQDVDLEAIELAELPGGGARVVERSLAEVNSQNSAIEAANARAASLGLDSTSHEEETIPVLMDPVELQEQPVSAEPGSRDEFEESFAEQSVKDYEEDFLQNDESHDQRIQIGEDDSEFMIDHDEKSETSGNERIRTAEAQTEFDEFENPRTPEPDIEPSLEADRDSDYEDPDDVLFDYQEDNSLASPRRSRFHEDEVDDEDEEDAERPDPLYQEDGMASVMPDYPDDEWADEEDEEDEIPDGFHEEEFGGYSNEESDEWSNEPDLEKGEEELDEEFASDDEIIAAFKGRQSTLRTKATEEEDFSDIDGYDFDDDELEEELPEHSDQARNEPAIGGSFEDSLEEFTMTAGERIGFNDSAKKSDAQQSELFDEDEGSEPEPTEKSGIRSLFSAFSRKQKDAPEDDERETPDFLSEEEDEISIAQAQGVDVETGAHSASIENPYDEAEPLAGNEVESDREEQIEQAEAQEASASQQSEVLVVNVMARDGYAFSGNELVQVLITSGLKFGEMNIFHRRLGNNDKGAVVFSVANILNPGTFDLNDMGNFTTPGVSLFLALPSPTNNLKAFEHMLEVAQHLRGALDGELKDDHRNVMTAQTIEHYRQRIRDFELRQLKAAGSRA